jgi:hypothetical protein
MKLPNKVTSFKNSTLAKFPIVLVEIKKKDYPVSILYKELEDKITLQDFIDVLDCLFALGQITLRKEIIHYVKRDTF